MIPICALLTRKSLYYGNLIKQNQFFPLFNYLPMLSFLFGFLEKNQFFKIQQNIKLVKSILFDIFVIILIILFFPLIFDIQCYNQITRKTIYFRICNFLYEFNFSHSLLYIVKIICIKIRLRM